MKSQKNVFTDSSDSEEEFELCDHEYTKSKGEVICLSCSLSERKASLFVSEEGNESRTIMHGPPPDELYGIVNEIFEELIEKLSSLEITVENSLEKLSKTCEKYMLSGNEPVREGGRRRSFRISARPKSLCATLLWREVLIRKLPLNITELSKKIGVDRTTILCVFKQLDDYKDFAASKIGRPRKK